GHPATLRSRFSQPYLCLYDSEEIAKIQDASGLISARQKWLDVSGFSAGPQVPGRQDRSLTWLVDQISKSFSCACLGRHVQDLLLALAFWQPVCDQRDFNAMLSIPISFSRGS